MNNKIKSPGLKRLFGEDKEAPEDKYSYNRLDIEIAMVNIGCPDILIEKLMKELEASR